MHFVTHNVSSKHVTKGVHCLSHRTKTDTSCPRVPGCDRWRPGVFVSQSLVIVSVVFPASSCSQNCFRWIVFGWKTSGFVITQAFAKKGKPETLRKNKQIDDTISLLKTKTFNR